jgi:hypothetical protein
VPRLTPLLPWAPAVVWATLPFTAGPALAAALAPAERSFATAASVALWVVWAAALVAAVVPRPATLTAVRTTFPAAVVAALWAALATPEPGTADAVALVATLLAAGLALSPVVGQRFVDGASYGPERRMPLRPSGWLLAGPIELAWAVAVAGAVAGPLLLAAGAWLAGTVAVVVGWPLVALAVRALHGLTGRVVVFVPAGLVVIDPTTLDGALPLLRPRLASLGPAPADTNALDLTAGALGLAVEVRLDQPQVVVRAARRGGPPVAPVEADRVLVAPSRPGAMLAEARRRGLTVA